MDATPTHNWSETGKNEYFEKVCGAVSMESSRIAAPIHNLWWNMDPPLHARVKGTIKTMGIGWWKCSEEGKDGSFFRQSYGHYLLGCAWHSVHRLSRKKKNNNRRSIEVLCSGSIEQHNQAEMTTFGKEKKCSFIRTMHLGTRCSCNGKIVWIMSVSYTHLDVYKRQTESWTQIKEFFCR